MDCGADKLDHVKLNDAMSLPSNELNNGKLLFRGRRLASWYERCETDPNQKAEKALSLMPAYCERLASAVEGRVIRIGTCILLQMTINLVGVGMGVVKEAEYV